MAKKKQMELVRCRDGACLATEQWPTLHMMDAFFKGYTRIPSDVTKAKQRALQPKDAAGPGFGSWNPSLAACNTATVTTVATVPGDSLPGIGPSSMGVLAHS